MRSMMFAAAKKRNIDLIIQLFYDLPITIDYILY